MGAEIERIREGGIKRARELIRDVEVPEDLLKLLAETVVKLGIRTSRAEIVTIRTAKALAALDGRARVTMEDLQKAMELALPHRLKAKPFERPRMPIPPHSQRPTKIMPRVGGKCLVQCITNRAVQC
ncbi:hypothetical protein [Vulcanisaeta distributa]|uniref:hypothetical protein n=1 Tax=Vulcanisaeta distributa TaxID=164451 RepID=UPI001FB557BD|nr:hypothetical protein [Vulcanisaeta distributa]